MRWSPRSPDLISLDLLLFYGYLKDTVYKRRYANLDEFQQRIMNLVNKIDRRIMARMHLQI